VNLAEASLLTVLGQVAFLSQCFLRSPCVIFQELKGSQLYLLCFCSFFCFHSCMFSLFFCTSFIIITTWLMFLQSSQLCLRSVFISEPLSVDDDVDVWRYAILELHARNDDDDDSFYCVLLMLCARYILYCLMRCCVIV